MIIIFSFLSLYYNIILSNTNRYKSILPFCYKGFFLFHKSYLPEFERRLPEFNTDACY